MLLRQIVQRAEAQRARRRGAATCPLLPSVIFVVVLCRTCATNRGSRNRRPHPRGWQRRSPSGRASTRPTSGPRWGCGAGPRGSPPAWPLWLFLITCGWYMLSAVPRTADASRTQLLWPPSSKASLTAASTCARSPAGSRLSGVSVGVLALPSGRVGRSGGGRRRRRNCWPRGEHLDWADC